MKYALSGYDYIVLLYGIKVRFCRQTVEQVLGKIPRYGEITFSRKPPGTRVMILYRGTSTGFDPRLFPAIITSDLGSGRITPTQLEAVTHLMKVFDVEDEFYVRTEPLKIKGYENGGIMTDEMILADTSGFGLYTDRRNE